jgi:hypothetical protein
MELEIWQPLDHFVLVCVDILGNSLCLKKNTIPSIKKIVIPNAFTETLLREPITKSKNLDQNA